MSPRVLPDDDGSLTAYALMGFVTTLGLIGLGVSALAAFWGFGRLRRKWWLRHG